MIMSAVIAALPAMMIVFYQGNVDAGPSRIRPKEELDEVFLALQPFGNECTTETNYSAKDMSRLSAAKVEGMIGKLYGDIVCCYTSIAVQHQLAVTYFVAAWHSDMSLMDILFDNEARLMLLLAYWLKGGPDVKMRPLWLIYTYHVYLLLVDRKSLVPDYTLFPMVHEAVTDELNSMVAECDQRSPLYRDNATNSEIQEDLLMLKSYPTSPLIRRKCIVLNRHQITECVDGNERARRAVADYGRWFTPDSLHLNHIMEQDRVLANLLRDFGQQERWVITSNNIWTQYGQVQRQTRPDLWAKALGGFLQNSVDLLKVLMLRFVCKHLLHLNHELRYTTGNPWFTGINWLHTSALKVLTEQNRLAVFWIKGFVEFMDFGDDPDFRYVLDLFENPVQDLRCIDKRNAAFRIVKDKMDAVSKSLGIIVWCPKALDVNDEAIFLNMIIQYLAPLNSIDVVAEELTVTIPRQLLVHSIRAMSVFVQYVQKKLVGVDMQIIKWFIDFTKELNIFKLKPRV